VYFSLQSEVGEAHNGDATNVNVNENVVAASSGQKSNLCEPGAKKTIKKKVIWADHCSKELVQLSFFYLEESERGKFNNKTYLLEIKFTNLCILFK
jgi:hypothetical protein